MAEQGRAATQTPRPRTRRPEDRSEPAPPHGNSDVEARTSKDENRGYLRRPLRRQIRDVRSAKPGRSPSPAAHCPHELSTSCSKASAPRHRAAVRHPRHQHRQGKITGRSSAPTSPPPSTARAAPSPRRPDVRHAHVGAPEDRAHRPGLQRTDRRQRAAGDARSSRPPEHHTRAQASTRDLHRRHRAARHHRHELPHRHAVGGTITSAAPPATPATPARPRRRPAPRGKRPRTVRAGLPPQRPQRLRALPDTTGQPLQRPPGMAHVLLVTQITAGTAFLYSPSQMASSTARTPPSKSTGRACSTGTRRRSAASSGPTSSHPTRPPSSRCSPTEPTLVFLERQPR